MTEILDALGDPVRLSVVKSLAGDGSKACGTFPVDVAKSTMSRHFRVLREAGLILMQPKATSYLNTLRREEVDSRFPGLLEIVLKYSGDI